MSASAKKKIRKEIKEAKLTERQQKEKKEAKKLKIYSICFTVLMVAIIVVALFFTGKKVWEQNAPKWTTAMKVGKHRIDCVEMNYYYRYAVTNFMQQNGNSVATAKSLHGVDMAQSLDKQQYYDEVGKTWANHFMDEAVKLATSDYAMYDKAKAAGFALTKQQEIDLDTELKMIQTQALSNGYTSVDDYVRAYYGFGADYDSFKTFLRRNYIASAYQVAYTDQIDISEHQINAFNADHKIEYSSFSYNSYTLTIDSHLDMIMEAAKAENTETTETTTNNTTENTEDAEEEKEEETPAEPTAEQQEAAKAATLAAAEALKKATSVAEFDAAIAALDVNKGKETAPKSTASTDVLYSNLNEDHKEWISADGRKAGDVEFFEKTSTSSSTEDVSAETVTGYTVICFAGRNDNTSKLDNVRHIFIELESDEVSGESSSSEDAYANAEAEAEKIFKEWEATGKTEENFIKLVNKYSDDMDAVDGLYENVSSYDGYYYGTFSNSARDWAIDPDRKVGDCEVITGDFGCHVMYYVGESDESYRHASIAHELRSRIGEEWYNNTVAAVKATVKVKNTKPMDFSTPLYLNEDTSATEDTATSDEHEGHNH